MTVAQPVDVGAPPREPICRSAKDPAQPCRFATVCHESRQRIQHYEDLRGRRCWAFQQFVQRQRHQARVRGGLICMNCGHDYTREYWTETDAATWNRSAPHPDPRICRACWRPAT